jgi:hypothetical protein
MTVLSEQSRNKLKAFLDEEARDYDDEYNPQAADPYSKIIAWAEDPELGGLPARSARGFADWISGCWSDWTEEPVTVKDVLEGAVTDWCGGRVMPS